MNISKIKMVFFAIYGAVGLCIQTVPLQAQLTSKTYFVPAPVTLPELVASGWEIASSNFDGSYILINEDRVALCTLGLTNGHLSFLRAYAQGSTEQFNWSKMTKLDSVCAWLDDKWKAE